MYVKNSLRIKRVKRTIRKLKFRILFLLLSLGVKIRLLIEFRKWVILGFIVGIIGGVSALAFQTTLTLTETVFGHVRLYLPLGVVASLFCGGLLSGFLVYSLAPEAEGHGTDAVIGAIHKRWSRIRMSTGIVKLLASALTIGSGGSAGKEGPIAQISAAFSSSIANMLKLRIPDRRVLVVSSIAAGIGAIFKAPLGAALFAIEVLYKRDFEVEAIIPSIIGSVVAYSIYCTIMGWEPLLSHPHYLFRNPFELLFFVILGLLMGISGNLYVKIFYLFNSLFKRLHIPPHFKPSLGALAVGAIGIFLPQVLGGGYEHISEALKGSYGWDLMLLLATFKVIATSLTIGSGGSGGVFAPSLYIGAMLGGVWGTILSLLFPDIVITPSAYALIGMTSFFSGAAKVPLASILMVIEITGGYSLLVPALIASAISYLVSGETSIYKEQIPNKTTSS